MINTNYLPGSVLVNQDTYTTNKTSKALLEKTAGNLAKITNTSPVLFLNPTFARDIKPIYDFNIINLGSGKQIKANNPPAVTQIASSGFYQYNFVSADSENIPFDDFLSDSFYFSTFFSPDSVSGTKTIVKIKGSEQDVLLRIVDTQLQIVVGDSVVYSFSETLTTDYWLVSLSISENTLYAGLAKQDTGEVFNDKALGGVSILKQTYSSLFVGGEMSDFFDGQMTNIYFSEQTRNSSEILEVISSNQILINSMALITANLKNKTSNLGAAIERTLLQSDYGYDIRFTPDYVDRVNNKPSLINDSDVYNSNGGYPTIWHRASVSANRNLFSQTSTLTTQTLTLPTGFFEFWFEFGAGSITSSDGTGTATGHGLVNSGKSNSRVIEVTNAGTFNFTVSGVVTNASLQHSISGGLSDDELIYQKQNNQSVSVDFDTPGWTFLFGTSKVNSNTITSRTSNNPDARFALDNSFVSNTIIAKFNAFLPGGGTANLSLDYGDGSVKTVALTGTSQSFQVELPKGSQGWVDISLSVNSTDYTIDNLEFINVENKSLGTGTVLTTGTYNGTTKPFRADLLKQDGGLVYNFDSSNAVRLETDYTETTPTNFSAVFVGKPVLGSYMIIFSKGALSDRLGLQSGGEVQFNSDSGNVITGAGKVTSGALTIIHLTVAWNTVKIYVNGVDESLTGSVTRTANTDPLIFGRATNSFLGQINEISYFANVTHTQAQVTAIYNNLNNKYS